MVQVIHTQSYFFKYTEQLIVAISIGEYKHKHAQRDIVHSNCYHQ